MGGWQLCLSVYLTQIDGGVRCPQTTAMQTSSWKRAHDRDTAKTHGPLGEWQTTGNRNLFSFSSPNGRGNGDFSKNLKALIIRVSLPISFAFTHKELCVQAGDLEAAVRHSRQQSPSLPNIQLCLSSQRWRRLGCPGVGGGKEEGPGGPEK